MTTQDIKQLIERLREAAALPTGLYAEAADALERLTQPVGAEPSKWLIEGYLYDVEQHAIIDDSVLPGQIPLYSAETVARLQASNAQLQAERDELVKALKNFILWVKNETIPTREVLDPAEALLDKVEGSKP